MTNHGNTNHGNTNHPKRAARIWRPDERSAHAQLRLMVKSGWLWDALEAAQASGGGVGPRCRYTLMDIVVMEVAAALCGNNTARAGRHLSDPHVWDGLRNAARRAFPNHPHRRLSQRAPSRQQHQRARRTLAGDTLARLEQELRTAAVRAAKDLGLFDPKAGTWTHPDATQCVTADGTWIPAAANHRNRPVLATSDDHRVVMLTAGDGPECIVLDAEAMPHGDCMGRSDADQAVAMLRRLLDEHGDTLRAGLRAFAYDMTLSSGNIDDVLDMGVLPVAKVPRVAGGGVRCGVIGVHPFTAADGATHPLEVVAVNGTPCVVVVDSGGARTNVTLGRQGFSWESRGQRVGAYGRYEIPAAAEVPAQLHGATTRIRLNSLELDARGNPHAVTRRSALLRPIPEGDEDFEHLYAVRGNTERMLADFKRGTTRRRSLRDTKLRIVAYRLLSIVNALAARRSHRTTPRAA